MAATEPHGVAIICERVQGHTVAWVDDTLSAYVPTGWFVEWWYACNRTYAGRLRGGYALQPWAAGVQGVPRRQWMDIGDAIAWCKRQAAKAQKGVA